LWEPPARVAGGRNSAGGGGGAGEEVNSSMGKGRRRPGRGRGWGGCVAPLSLSASVFWDTRGPVRSEAVLFQNSGRQLTMYYYKVMNLSDDSNNFTSIIILL